MIEVRVSDKYKNKCYKTYPDVELKGMIDAFRDIQEEYDNNIVSRVSALDIIKSELKRDNIDIELYLCIHEAIVYHDEPYQIIWVSDNGNEHKYVNPKYEEIDSSNMDKYSMMLEFAIEDDKPKYIITLMQEIDGFEDKIIEFLSSQG